MLTSFFYHERIRKTVAMFGSLFKEIYVLRKNSAGDIRSSVRVPLSYSPKQKYLERIRENTDLDTDTKVAIKLPRMSFEIVNYAYAPERQINKIQYQNQSVPGVVAGRKKLFSPVPYNINLQLNIYAKTQEDALQIVEQIIPYFGPQYSLTITPFEDYDILEDVPITLQSLSFIDNYEGSMADRRMIIYTLDFEMHANFYGPTGPTPNIIRKVINNLYLMNEGPADSDVKFATITVLPNPLNVSPDSDYGFTTTIVETIDST